MAGACRRGRRGATAVPEGWAALVLAAALLLYALAPPLWLALLGAAAFAVAATRWPRLGLAAVVATLPTYYFPRQLGGLAVSLPETALLLTTAAVLVRAVMVRDLRLRSSAFDGPIALLLLAALLSLLPTEYLHLSLRALRTLVLEPLLFFYLVRALCPELARLRPLWLALLGAATATSLLALAQVGARLNVVEVEGVRRALGLYPSPNHLALFLGRALPLAVALACWVPRWRRWAAGVAGVIGLALAATFSIGGWLGAAASGAVLALLLGRRALVGFAAACAAAGGVVVALGARLGIERLQPGGATATFRQQIWAAAVAMVRDHPLLGIGLDNFLYRYQLEYMRPEAWAEPNISHPHNWLLQFWLELGLLGLVAFGLLLARAARLARRAWRQARDAETRALVAGAAASLAGWLVHGALDNSYFLVDLAILFWLHLALLEAAAAPRPTRG
jgi:putative inorganic carbon (HCO3(-)) transporter